MEINTNIDDKNENKENNIDIENDIFEEGRKIKEKDNNDAMGDSNNALILDDDVKTSSKNERINDKIQGMTEKEEY